jgi:hypothetical protein
MPSLHVKIQPRVLPPPRGRPWLWDRALVSVRGASLTARLAAGASPESGRLIALRARALVVPAQRQRLASDWDRLVSVASERPPAVARVPLRRDRIVAAEADIRELQRSLRACAPVPARGVAMASKLLVDGAGPVYNRNSRIDLRAAVQEAIQHLDPSTALLPTSSGGAEWSGPPPADLRRRSSPA